MGRPPDIEPLDLHEQGLVLHLGKRGMGINAPGSILWPSIQDFVSIGSQFLHAERLLDEVDILFQYALVGNPIVTVSSAVRICTTTRPTASKAILSLCGAGILEETSGRSRDRTYAYRQ